MNLKIDRDSQVPMYLQISGGIGAMIRSGELPSGYKLPSERQLAAELDVHRNTIVKSYMELIADSLITASRQHPRGYFVGDGTGLRNTSGFFPLEQTIRYSFDQAVREMMERYFRSDDEGVLSFGGMALRNKLGYIPALDDATRRIFDPDGGGNLREYQQEIERLRNNISRTLEDRNIYVPSGNIQIVTEDYSAMSHLIDMYTEPGDCIAAEEPMSPEFAALIANKGVRICTIRMEEDGVDLGQLELEIRKHKPKFFYTMPCSHNPTGITMSVNKRERLLGLAEKYELMIIEHDWLRWLNPDASKLPTLYMMDRGRSLVYIDSFALMCPYGIQIGYLLGPEETASMMGRLTTISEKVPGNISFFYLNAYLESGALQEYMRSIPEDCIERRKLLTDALLPLRPYGLRWSEGEGGMHIWCRLPESADAGKFYEILERRSVIVIPGKLFYRSGRDSAENFRICYTNVSKDSIVHGAEIIGEALLASL